MKITAVNTIKNNYFTQNRPVSFKQGQDTFVKSSQPKTFEQITQSKRKFDISDYKSLSKKEIKIAKEKANGLTEQAAKDNIFVAEYIKEYLDKIYGEDKYVFACIGTSPSGIGRVLEFMGVETKYFPASDFRDYGRICKVLDNNPKADNTYLSFLNSQGITNEEIENNDKTVLFVDYADRGYTLECFEKFIKGRAKINSKKVKFKDIYHMIGYATKDVESLEKEMRIMKYINKYLVSAAIADYTGVPHLSVYNFENFDKVLKENDLMSSKLYNLLIIDELNNKGKLKENPLNKNSL